MKKSNCLKRFPHTYYTKGEEQESPPLKILYSTYIVIP